MIKEKLFFISILLSVQATAQQKQAAAKKLQIAKTEAEQRAAALKRLQEDFAAGRISKTDIQKLSAAKK